MKGYSTQLLLSMSLATITLSAPSAVQPPAAAARNKRSFFTDHGQRHFSRSHLNSILRKSKLESKRSGFDTLDLDMLFNDPFFLELEAETEKEMNGLNHLGGAHEPFSTDNNGLESGFEHALESELQNDMPLKSDVQNGVESNLHKGLGAGVHNGLESEFRNGLESAVPNGLGNGLSKQMNNGLEFNVLRTQKDEMSNVIPGAIGPYDTAPSRGVQEIADSMMDEFLDFLTLKEMGLLDSCMGRKRR